MGTKMPFQSIITSVVALAYTLTPFSGPAGTMAAFATMRPSSEFSVEAQGLLVQPGHSVR